MDERMLRVRLGVDTATDDPYQQMEATQDLRGDIGQMAAAHTGLIVDRSAEPPTQRGPISTIVIDVAAALTAGLFGVISAYVARQRAVTVEISIQAENGRSMTVKVPSNTAIPHLEEWIRVVQHGLEGSAAEVTIPSSDPNET
jgi:hypothetical protein